MRPRARLCFVSVALVGGWFCGSSPSRAQDLATVDFAWSAPAGCPPDAAVRAEIGKLLGGPIEGRAREDLRVRAVVERRELWLVTLDTLAGGTAGHRTLESATCEGLASATALIVALIIDPDAVAAHAKPTPDATPAPPPTRAPAVTPPPPPPPRATFSLVGVGAVGHLGVLPGADVGLGAHVGLARRSLRVELRGAYGPRAVASSRVGAAGEAYGKFRFWAATLAGCWMLERGRLELGPCLDLELGAVAGEGVGATETTSATTWWYGMGAGVELVIAATPWLRFPVHADAIVPWHRPSYVFRNVDQPIFRPWPVGARLSLAAEARF